MIRLLLLITLFPQAVIAGNGPTVESFNEESARYNLESQKHISADNTKQILGAYKPAKESGYKESELRAKAQNLINTAAVRANDQNLSAAERAEAKAAVSLTESHRTRKKFDKLTSEGWMEISNQVTENPLIGVGSACSISGSKDEKIEIKGEAYEVEVDDTREVESEEACEEDGTEIHKCTQKLQLSCSSLGQETNIFGSLVTAGNIEVKRYYYNPKGAKNPAKAQFLSPEPLPYDWLSVPYNHANNGVSLDISSNHSTLNLIHYFAKIRLYINDIEKLSAFRLTNLHQGNYLVAYVNGQKVGDFHEQATWSGGGYHYTNDNVNRVIDLRSYMNNGENSVTVIINTLSPAFTVPPAFSINFSGAQRICSSWQESWEEVCE